MTLTAKTVHELQLNWAEIIYVKAFGFWDEYEDEGQRSARELALAEVVDLEDLPRRMDEMLQTLTPREEKVLRMRADMMSCEEIGREFGVSRSRVGQIEQKALAKLRHRSRAYHLKNGMSRYDFSCEAALKLQTEGYSSNDVARAAASDLLMVLNPGEIAQIAVEQADQVYDSDSDRLGRPALTLGDMLGLCLTDLHLYDRVMDAFSNSSKPVEWRKQNRMENAVLLADLTDVQQVAKRLWIRDNRKWQEAVEAGPDAGDCLVDVDLDDDIEAELRAYEVEFEEGVSVMTPSRLAKLTISDLELSERAGNCLARGKISTVEELVQHSEKDLLKIRNMGAKSVAEVKAALEAFGLTLKGE